MHKRDQHGYALATTIQSERIMAANPQSVFEHQQTVPRPLPVRQIATPSGTVNEVPEIDYQEMVSAMDLARTENDHERLFRQLFARHQGRLYRFVIRYIDHPEDAADIAQQAFAEAARTIGTFRGDSKLSTWLFGIAMNMVRNYLSRAPHRVYKFETEESLAHFAAPDMDPSEHLTQKQMLGMVSEALAELPPEMSEVLTLVAVDEISYQDAANILNIPLGTVRSRVSRARAVLREHFKKAGVALNF
ncbi:RNA polymerase sigma factor [Lacisediminimonas sp.]|uniref:RNA polymerase sigma factor n=1 Tax=Lacisediminimonas sp. TaxID=3060582 RepID=UPI00272D0A52|nr:RNA polymerase sigma factor [Lacisediminimonas sp.]